ncbi:MAG: DnaB-like helicase C-terminal domain-containing protein [Cetobacterium sp.]
MDYMNLENRNIESLVNTEAERVVLGTLITEIKTHKEITNMKASMFSERANKSVYKAIEYLDRNEKPIDLPNISSVLKSKGIELTISSLTNLTMYGNLYSFKGSLDILKELQVKRSIYEKACKLAEGVLEGGSIDSLMYDFEEHTKEIDTSEKYDDSIQAVIEKLFDRLNSEVEKSIEFGVPVLDRIIGGLFPTEVTTIAAKSGVGKTALALYIALNVLRQGKKVLIITREMTDEHILQRLVTRTTGVSSKSMKNRDLGEEEWTAMMSALGEFGAYKCHINDKVSKISEIRKRIREVKPDLVIVDYLQLLTSETNSNNREREVASISRGLKEIAQQFKLPLIQLSQLNDGFTGRPFGEGPIRESKAIYQDSNNVIYIHKPTTAKDMEEFTKEEALRESLLEMNISDSAVKAIEIVVSKCRDGGTAIEKMWYEGNTLNYKNWN